MCLDGFGDDDNDDPVTPDDVKAFFAGFDGAKNFRPDDRLSLFGCEISIEDLQLANILLSRFPRLESACNVLRAADALRGVIGAGQVIPCQRTSEWNAGHRIGQQVQFWPDGRNGQSYLSTTTSPAFDTPRGSFVLVNDHSKAVSLFNVVARSVVSPEVDR